MREKGITVIIPIYNSKKYLDRCIQSIIQQGNCISEIICVDDGSIDNSFEIVQYYQRYDNRILLIRESHHGVSYARNIGKSYAKGTYIMFMDADDYLLENRLGGLLRKAYKHNADILVFGGQADDVWHAPEWVQKVTNTRNHLFSSKKYNKCFKERGSFPVVWNKLYKKEIIDSVEFSEELTIAEDNVFHFLVLLEAKKIVFCAKRVYVYCSNDTSALALTNDEIKREQHNRAIEIVKQKLEERGILDCYLYEFELWKKEIDGSKKIKRKKASKILNYVKEYGFRSMLEHAIGKCFIKQKK